MNRKSKMIIWIWAIILMIPVGFACSAGDDEPIIEEEKAFALLSSEIGDDNMLPSRYTCDGEGIILPLEWENPPGDVQSFTLIMSHEAPEDIHCYWILYNIPADVIELLGNVSGIGNLGTNTVNGLCEYAPPCSQGPGEKTYIFTLYALSSVLEIDIPLTEVDYGFIMNELEAITLDSTSLTVQYSRQIN